MDLSRFSMEDRTVIVTGGSGGIGLGCARAFAQAGANIAIVGVPVGSLPPAVSEIDAYGVQVMSVLTDVTQEDQVRVMVQEVMDRFGRIDALINVAGGTYSRNPEMPQFNRAPLLELSPEDFMMAYDVNVKTAFLCAKAVVPHMKAAGKGVIVNTGSESGILNRRQGGEFSAYGSAKAALHRLTVFMAYQWGPEVRAVCIAPGTIDTPRPGGSVRPEIRNAGERIAIGRVGTPDDIASVALFLASDAASYVNAVVVPVHGGN